MIDAKGLGLVCVAPACISDLSSAVTDLTNANPDAFGGAGGGEATAFSLYTFSFSCGTLVGPPIAGILKAKADWGAATLALAVACFLASIPAVSLFPNDVRCRKC